MLFGCSRASARRWSEGGWTVWPDENIRSSRQYISLGLHLLKQRAWLAHCQVTCNASHNYAKLQGAPLYSRGLNSEEGVDQGLLITQHRQAASPSPSGSITTRRLPPPQHPNTAALHHYTFSGYSAQPKWHQIDHRAKRLPGRCRI